MAQEDDLHDEAPPRAHETPGVKVYDRPSRALPPAWMLILLALLVLVGVWLAFTYLF